MCAHTHTHTHTHIYKHSLYIYLTHTVTFLSLYPTILILSYGVSFTDSKQFNVDTLYVQTTFTRWLTVTRLHTHARKRTQVHTLSTYKETHARTHTHTHKHTQTHTHVEHLQRNTRTYTCKHAGRYQRGPSQTSVS